MTAGALSGRSFIEWRKGTAGALEHLWWAQVLRGKPVDVAKTGAIHVIDLFCGTGGLTLGASRAVEACGMNYVPLAAVDVDVEALGVYSSNFRPLTPIAANLGSLVDYHVYGRGETAELAYSPEIENASLSALAGKVDLVLAGPPCQGHSNLNNRTRRDDPRNTLYVAAAAMAIALKTKALVIENVPEVLSDRSNVVGTTRNVLEKSGYCVSMGVLSATELGGAQSRRRHFLVATRNQHVDVKSVVGALGAPPMTLRDAIGDLEDAPHRSFMDDVPILSAENLDRINHLFDNDIYDLPNEVRPDCHRNGHTYPSVYGRLDWDKPSQTITTGFMSPGRGRYIHPSQRRVITAREAARIQGFPDWFDFSAGGAPPSKRLLSKWIGDAVPSWLGYAAVLAAMSGV